MAVYKKEAGLCHGRGFSSGDEIGFLAKFLSWSKRPAVDGSSHIFSVDYTTDIVTDAGHGFVTGDSVKLTLDVGGTLPGGLALLTEYYVIYIDANTYYLATSYYNATIGTKIDITSAGSGTFRIYKLGGGPGWYLREDKSNPTSKTFTADNTTETFTVSGGHDYGTGDKVWVSTTGTLPAGLVAGTSYYAIYLSSTTFKLATSIANAYAGTAINITSNGSGTHSVIMVEKYIVICDTASPAVNDIDTGPGGLPPKFIKIGLYNSDAGFVRITHFLWWDTTTKTGHGCWDGHKINTSDDADFSYYFFGGAESMFIVSRIGTAYSIGYVTDFVGDTNFDIEGTDKYGTIQSGISGTSNVTVQLDTGEAANFTAGNYYFIFDFDGHSWCDCTKVVSVDGGADTMVLESITHNYPAGAKIASYAHRFCAGGSHTADDANQNDDSNGTSKIPYINAISGYAFHSQGGAIQGAITAQIASAYLNRVNPNRKGKYGTSEIGITEYYFENYIYFNQYLIQSYGAHEAYGVLKNVLTSKINTMSAGLDGRIDQGLNYIYFVNMNNVFPNSDSSFAFLILDTESDS